MAGQEDCRLHITSRLALVGLDLQLSPVVDDLDTGQPVFLPFRMSCFVLSNLVVTAGMLTPNLQVIHVGLQWYGIR